MASISCLLNLNLVIHSPVHYAICQVDISYAVSGGAIPHPNIVFTILRYVTLSPFIPSTYIFDYKITVELWHLLFKYIIQTENSCRQIYLE